MPLLPLPLRAGAQAKVVAGDAVPCEVPPHPSYLPLAELSTSGDGAWRTLCEAKKGK